jgi:hypothetical protein
MKTALTLITCLFILASCSKPPEPITDIKVTGRIMDSVNKTPFNDTKFLLFQRYHKGTIGSEDQLVWVMTDSLGYFSATFNISESQGITLAWPEFERGMSSKTVIAMGLARDDQRNRMSSYDFGTVYTSKNF